MEELYKVSELAEKFCETQGFRITSSVLIYIFEKLGWVLNWKPASFDNEFYSIADEDTVDAPDYSQYGDDYDPYTAFHAVSDIWHLSKKGEALGGEEIKYTNNDAGEVFYEGKKIENFYFREDAVKFPIDVLKIPEFTEKLYWYSSPDRHVVRSSFEKYIDSFLYFNGIYHEYEKELIYDSNILREYVSDVFSDTNEEILEEMPIYKPIKPDFYIKIKERKGVWREFYIEYWGMKGDKQYDKRVNRKKYLYRKKFPNIHLIELYKEEIDSNLIVSLAEENERYCYKNNLEICLAEKFDKYDVDFFSGGEEPIITDIDKLIEHNISLYKRNKK